jgi:hypothetical protein
MKFSPGTSSLNASNSQSITSIDKISISEGSRGTSLGMNTIFIKYYHERGTFCARSLRSLLVCHSRGCSDTRHKMWSGMQSKTCLMHQTHLYLTVAIDHLIYIGLYCLSSCLGNLERPARYLYKRSEKPEYRAEYLGT